MPDKSRALSKAIFAPKDLILRASRIAGICFAGGLLVAATVPAISAEGVPTGLPAVVHPKDNPSTAEKIELGKQLYFDGRLSRDNKVSRELPRSFEGLQQRRPVRDGSR